MSFFPITPKPGIIRDPTAFASQGSWYDCDKVRFRSGWPETIGGWAKFVDKSYQGVGRFLYDWVSATSTKYLGIGTTWKLFVNQGDNVYDITSVRRAVTLGANPFTTVNASGVITVADTSHGAVLGDYVIIGNAATTNGVAAAKLNIEHRINSIPSVNSYTILVASAASSSGTGGGSTVTADYLDNVSLDIYLAGGAGWGVGTWGSGPWGGVREIEATGQLRTWSMADFGDDLFATVRGGTVSFWDESEGVDTRAKNLSSVARKTTTLASNPISVINTTTAITITDDNGHDLGVNDKVTISGATATGGVPVDELNANHTVVTTPTETTFTVTTATAATSTATGGGSSVTAAYVVGAHYGPDKAMSVIVSDQARHAVCLGTTPVGSTDIDPLLIRWCESDDIATWRPKLSNLAGGQRLSSGSLILGGVQTRQEIVVWTDSSMHSMRYVGAPLVYAFSELATDISLISPNAFSVSGGNIWFMARGGFYSYSGKLVELQCPVEDYVFSDLDTTQIYKVTCGSNNDFSEIWWHYPSLTDDTGENSRYVIYNRRDNIWYFGTLARPYWTDAPTKALPMATTYNGGMSSFTDPVATTNTSGTVVVSYLAHGMIVNDKVVISGSAAVGGLGTTVINAEHTVTAVATNTFTFVVPDVATSTTTGGGSSVTVRMPQYVLKHESGYGDESNVIAAHIESSDMVIQNGDWAWFIDNLIPDIKFRGASGGTDEVTLAIKGKNYPGATMATLFSTDIVATDEQKQVRGRARHISLNASSSASEFGWRLGVTRINVREDGRR